jgi:thioredoxin 1
MHKSYNVSSMSFDGSNELNSYRSNIMSQAVELLDDETFPSKISKGVTLVDFFAEWCGPCRMLTPILEELNEELTDGASVAKVDIDSASSIAKQFEITSVPTIILFKEGNEIERIVGLREKDELKTMVEAAAKN